MKFYWLPVVLVLAIPPLYAGTINVTGDPFVLLQTGDELVFQINIQNYKSDGRHYGAPALPQSMDFVFVTEPTGFDGQFGATLASTNGSTVLPFPEPLSFTSGFFQGSGYTGPVSTLTASMDLSTQQADALFPGVAATVDLRNLGGEIKLGLPPYTLSQDFNLTLDGGPISVGARITSVTLEHTSGSPVPEPNSGPLMVGGGAVLCLLARMLGRYPHDSEHG